MIIKTLLLVLQQPFNMHYFILIENVFNINFIFYFNNNSDVMFVNYKEWENVSSK